MKCLAKARRRKYRLRAITTPRHPRNLRGGRELKSSSSEILGLHTVEVAQHPDPPGRAVACDQRGHLQLLRPKELREKAAANQPITSNEALFLLSVIDERDMFLKAHEARSIFDTSA